MKRLIMLIMAGLVFPAAALAGPYSGLWISEIEIDKVNEVASKVDADTPRPVANTFDLRLLIHVDAAGQVRLLRDVTVMQKRVSVEENGETQERAVRVLITDDALLPDLEGVVRRNGELVGVRLASVGTEFETGLNELALTGAVGPEESVSGTMTISENHPANPFRHKFHPDHQSGFDVTRDIRLDFQPAPADAAPEDDVSSLRGTYHETITGLHKAPIKLEGTFRLDRVSDIDALNDI